MLASKIPVISTSALGQIAAAMIGDENIRRGLLIRSTSLEVGLTVLWKKQRENKMEL